ncbi:MAG TPA: hypothetical protein VK817_26665 [Trebonia sp.]|jgi:hypothetical protein|nr:hypothetical protein [Trebonia sp.]
MTETVEALERRIDQLRVAVREAVLASEQARARQLRTELRAAEDAWEDALADAAPATDPEDDQAPGPVADPGAPLLPLREQVYEALSLLQVPAAPKLIATVHEAFFATTFPTQRVTSLRRDEERSFRTAPFARPYYICAALTADYLSPSRGLLAVSTWPMEERVIGPLSPRVDFLEAAIRVAQAIERIPAPVPAARRLLLRFAASIPGASDATNHANPRAVKAAAEAELSVHKDKDAATRKAAAERARQQLGDAEQFFGAPKSGPAGRVSGDSASGNPATGTPGVLSA